MSARSQMTKRAMKGPFANGPRFGGPSKGRPIKNRVAKPLGIQPAPKGEGKRTYLPGARGHSASQGKAFGDFSISPKGKRDIRRYGNR